MISQQSPVITLDGSSGVGKGSMARRIADELHWQLLDSGVIYRVLAYQAVKDGVRLSDSEGLVELAQKLNLLFPVEQNQSEVPVLLDGVDVSEVVRLPECGNNASKIAVLPSVRQALLQRQRDFRQPPGLVCDGRDMGTVVFPDAEVKFFLVASAEVRAERRYFQLKQKGMNVNLREILEAIQQRDARDSQRDVAPLVAADDAIIIDTSELSIAEVFAVLMEHLTMFHSR